MSLRRYVAFLVVFGLGFGTAWALRPPPRPAPVQFPEAITLLNVNRFDPVIDSSADLVVVAASDGKPEFARLSSASENAGLWQLRLVYGDRETVIFARVRAASPKP